MRCATAASVTPWRSIRPWPSGPGCRSSAWSRSRPGTKRSPAGLAPTGLRVLRGVPPLLEQLDLRPLVGIGGHVHLGLVHRSARREVGAAAPVVLVAIVLLTAAGARVVVVAMVVAVVVTRVATAVMRRDHAIVVIAVV